MVRIRARGRLLVWSACIALGCGTPLASELTVSGDVTALGVAATGAPVVYTDATGVIEWESNEWAPRLRAVGSGFALEVAPDESIWLLHDARRTSVTRAGLDGATQRFDVGHDLQLTAVDAGPDGRVWVAAAAARELFVGDASRLVAVDVPNGIMHGARVFAFDGGVWIVGRSIWRFEWPARWTRFVPEWDFDEELVASDGAGGLVAWVGSNTAPHLLHVTSDSVTTLSRPTLANEEVPLTLAGAAADDLWLGTSRQPGACLGDCQGTTHLHFDGSRWSRIGFTPRHPRSVAAAAGRVYVVMEPPRGEVARLFELDASDGGPTVEEEPGGLYGVAITEVDPLAREGAVRGTFTCAGRASPSPGGIEPVRLGVDRVATGVEIPAGRLCVTPEGGLEVSQCFDAVSPPATLELPVPSRVRFDLHEAGRELVAHHVEVTADGVRLEIPRPRDASDSGTPLYVRALDCDQQLASRAEVRLFDSSGARIYEAIETSGHTSVFRSGWRPYYQTGRVGRFNSNGHVTISNVPVPEDGSGIRVEMWGARADGGPIERLGCEEVVMQSGVDAVVDVGPMRADGPASCR